MNKLKNYAFIVGCPLSPFRMSEQIKDGVYDNKQLRLKFPLKLKATDELLRTGRPVIILFYPVYDNGNSIKYPPSENIIKVRRVPCFLQSKSPTTNITKIGRLKKTGFMDAGITFKRINAQPKNKIGTRITRIRSVIFFGSSCILYASHPVTIMQITTITTRIPNARNSAKKGKIKHENEIIIAATYKPFRLAKFFSMMRQFKAIN